MFGHTNAVRFFGTAVHECRTICSMAEWHCDQCNSRPSKRRKLDLQRKFLSDLPTDCLDNVVQFCDAYSSVQLMYTSRLFSKISRRGALLFFLGRQSYLPE